MFRCVAAARSTLSSPAPWRPITRSRGAAAIISASSGDSRTITASASAIARRRIAGVDCWSTRTSAAARSTASPASWMGSEMTTTGRIRSKDSLSLSLPRRAEQHVDDAQRDQGGSLAPDLKHLAGVCGQRHRQCLQEINLGLLQNDRGLDRQLSHGQSADVAAQGQLADVDISKDAYARQHQRAVEDHIHATPHAGQRAHRNPRNRHGDRIVADQRLQNRHQHGEVLGPPAWHRPRVLSSKPPNEPPFRRRVSMADSAATLAYLQKVPLFRTLPAKELEFIARSVKERVYQPGTAIVKQGEPGVGFFLIAEGRVEVARDGHRIRDMGPGEFLGEMALMEERIRTATVTAKDRTRCLQLVRWDFRALLKENPDLAVKMLEVVVQRLREHPPTHESD